MGDILLALSIPLIVCASGLYALAETWWLRRHQPAGADDGRHRTPVVVREAEAVVAEAYERLGTLYEARTVHPAGS
ncbi:MULTISPECIES: hypothetical protein [Streptomyces]|uniref:Uncharacterized protein n=1 Tax=Streptomyces lichenis TaxID=2306967 RepID=A0ABT0I9W3_9ACTN|nr:hypothetical protein [Streptomyces lichenis]MCK8678116.1 hypothetical protein [Streptomyces lichenis]